MILAVDAGNTHIVLGVYKRKKLLHHWRLSTERAGTADEYGIMIHQLFQHVGLPAGEVEGVIISSVVPPLTKTLETVSLQYLNQTPLIVGPGIKTGLNIRIENPREMGADRIVNAVAALEIYGPPLIIVDFGTATTIDYIDAAGQLLGSAIAPGIGISTEALFLKTAKLPRVELVKPASTVGRNTAAAMQSGIIFGFAGQVDGIVLRMKEEFHAEAKVIATGGLAELISGESRTIEVVNALLTLHGLQMIYDRNR